MKLILGTIFSLSFNPDDGAALLSLLARGVPVSLKYSAVLNRITYETEPGHGIQIELVDNDQIVSSEPGTNPA